MKFMKLGNQPDTFLAEEDTRTLTSDVPSDITIQINSIMYLLHKYPLLPKCGLLQRILSESEDSSEFAFALHDIPGGEDAFELCAKFCYGITITLSAHNIAPAFCAAKFLEMTEIIENGNFCTKLEAFFSSCILQGWKDSIVALQKTAAVYEWCENLGLVRKCIESIVDKILTPPHKVSWSYSYTRPGYERKHRFPVPRDWWTEDVSFLDVDMFRCILAAVNSTNMVEAQLIGEALHVYACRWLPDTTDARWKEGSSSTSTSRGEGSDQNCPDRKQRILEIIVGLIPAEKGSVSFKFLLRLLSMAYFLGVSPVTKAQLLRLAGLQLEDAVVADLLLPAPQTLDDQNSYAGGFDLVKAVLENFLRQWKRVALTDQNESVRSINKVGKLVDSYLQEISKDAGIPVQKVVSLAEMLPEMARSQHDSLYKAINIYLKEHPNLSKTDKKQLCGILDCRKLSPEIRAHAVKNESLPLRIVVQLLFFEQEKGSGITTNLTHSSSDKVGGIRDDLNKVKLTENHDHQSGKVKGNQRSIPGTSRASDEWKLKPELSFKIRESAGSDMSKGKEIRSVSEIQKLDPRKKAQERKSQGKDR